MLGWGGVGCGGSCESCCDVCVWEAGKAREEEVVAAGSSAGVSGEVDCGSAWALGSVGECVSRDRSHDL